MTPSCARLLPSTVRRDRVVQTAFRIRSRSMIGMVIAMLMASLTAGAALAGDQRDDRLTVHKMHRCAPGPVSTAGGNRNACRRVHLRTRERVAMARKGPQSASATRPYDFPNSYVLHGPHF